MTPANKAGVIFTGGFRKINLAIILVKTVLISA